MSDDDWKYFLYRWKCYKKVPRLQGEDIVVELVECCCEQVQVIFTRSSRLSAA